MEACLKEKIEMKKRNDEKMMIFKKKFKDIVPSDKDLKQFYESLECFK